MTPKAVAEAGLAEEGRGPLLGLRPRKGVRPWRAASRPPGAHRAHAARAAKGPAPWSVPAGGGDRS